MLPGSLMLSLFAICAPNEAELLLNEMAARIIEAKSFRVEFAVEMEQDGQDTKVAQGWLVVAEGNRFRYDVLVGKERTIMVGNGKKFTLLRKGDGGAVPQTSPLPAWHNEVLKSWLGRGGTFLSLLTMSEVLNKLRKGKPGTDDSPNATDAKLLPEEHLNGIKTRVVEYQLSWTLAAEGLRNATVQVWIDPKTKLPVRRTMVFKDSSGQKFTARHARFEINPKLDDKMFELADRK
ncbi:MAG TPA: DUF2092 domain-containing protein [Gemmata sp.]|nr:DUF2092 domain-containing protein [Gemmata sp.]